MTICEICGTDVRRRDRVEDKLVCWWCRYNLGRPKQDVVQELRRLEDENDELKSKIPPRIPKIEYRFNSPFSAIPPLDILKNAIIALDVGRYFSEFSQVLGDYYEINAPCYYANDEKVPDGSIAAYYPSSNEVYSFKTKSLSRKTAFHEFYHALQNYGVVPKKDSEKNADLYAEGCVQRLAVS